MSSKLIEEINYEIRRIKNEIKEKVITEDCEAALRVLLGLIYREPNNPRAIKMLEKISEALKEIDGVNPPHLALEKILKIADHYRQSDLSLPWLRALGILSFVVIGMILGAAVGAIAGALMFLVALCPVLMLVTAGTLPGLLLVAAVMGAMVGVVIGGEKGLLAGQKFFVGEGDGISELMSQVFYPEKERKSLRTVAQMLFFALSPQIPAEEGKEQLALAIS